MRLIILAGLLTSSSLFSAVISAGNGGDLENGTVTVFFSNNTSASGTISRKGSDPATGIFGTSGTSFYFEIQGSTYDNPWLLRNQTSSLLITSFQINLLGSISVFDAQGAPGLTTTPLHSGSQLTKLPAILTGPSGTTISSYSFSNQFDPAGGLNAFRSLTVNLGGSQLAAGSQLTFQADTDLAVPETDTVALLGLGLIILGLRRSRRQ